ISQSDIIPKTTGILKNRDPPSYHEFQRTKLLHQQQNNSYSEDDRVSYAPTLQAKSLSHHHQQQHHHQEQQQQQDKEQYSHRQQHHPYHHHQSQQEHHQSQQEDLPPSRQRPQVLEQLDPKPQQSYLHQSFDLLDHHQQEHHQPQQLRPSQSRNPEKPHQNHPTPSILQQHLDYQLQKQLKLQQHQQPPPPKLQHQHKQQETHQQHQQLQQQQQQPQHKQPEQNDNNHHLVHERNVQNQTSTDVLNSSCQGGVSEKQDNQDGDCSQQPRQPLRSKTPIAGLQAESEQVALEPKDQNTKDQENLEQSQQIHTKHEQKQRQQQHQQKQQLQQQQQQQNCSNHHQEEERCQRENVQKSLCDKHHYHMQQQQQHLQHQQQQQQQLEQYRAHQDQSPDSNPDQDVNLSHDLAGEEDPRTPTPGHTGGTPVSPSLTLAFPEYEQGRPPSAGSKPKQHTNWSGVLQDLFGLDSTHHTAESTHESTSSGVASDVTSVYPSPQDGCRHTSVRTFKGGDSAGSASSDQQSQDSGNRSTSAPSSPKGDYPPFSHGRNLRQNGLTAHALALNAKRKGSLAGSRTPDPHLQHLKECGHIEDNDVPPPLPKRNITPRPNLSHAHSKDRPRPQDLSIATSFQKKTGKPYLPTHMDRLFNGGGGVERLDAGLMSPRDLKDPNSDPGNSEACYCSACHSLAASMAAVQTYHGSRADVRTRTSRNGDPDAFYRYSGCGGNVAGEGSFTDSAVGLESFGYDRSQNQHIPKKGHDLDRSRTSSSPASPVPPGGFYHTKHFLPPFPECNGFSHQNIPQAQPIKPSSAHKASRLRHKQLDKQYPHEGKQILSQNFMNPDFFSQDCVHCDQERKLFENAHHQYHQTQLTHHQHQMHNHNTNHTLQQPN
ncbi:hypothetical protein EGW08_021895, partial [Elysia chlorotica]